MTTALRSIRKGTTTDDILNKLKGKIERRHFYKFAEFGNYVLGFGGSTKKSDIAISWGGGYVIPSWLIAVEKSVVEKMDSENCPDYLANAVIKKFLSCCESEIAVSVIYNRELLYFDADDEAFESILKKAKEVLS